MNERLDPAQRIVLIVAAIGFLHSSIVPPVTQVDGITCRYHAFLERQLPYTLGHDAPNADIGALLSECGMLGAVAALALLAIGFGGGGQFRPRRLMSALPTSIVVD